MALLMIGIDEAGFGPMLGPLCVGMSAFLIEGWREGDQKPCLWERLEAGACRDAGDKRGRVAFADSKELKLPNNSAKRHPLTHLERGVLAAVASREGGRAPETDSVLHELLGAQLRGHAWYEGEPVALPVSGSAAQMGIASNLLAGAMTGAGIRIVATRCRVMDEREFNGIVRDAGNKGEVCIAALADHLQSVISLMEQHPGASVRIACDKLGGRDSYAPVLERLMPGWECTILEQAADKSNYEMRWRAQTRGANQPTPNRHLRGGCFRISFQAEAEKEHLPVALASMIAKYTRELAMHRFNRYWLSRMPELKPTAGYTLDARRWLADAAPVLTREEKAAMVRRA
ncbi:MAG: hypothetical protein KF805_17085 [Phycisphaeraceae bacterium]|nr:hypothetical protein [Phycisphaeraceae bacterium]